MSNQAVQRFEGTNGARVYQISLRALPHVIAHTYLVIDDSYAALIDVGSGSVESNADLEAGLARVRSEYGEPIGWDLLNRVIITHGHIDHCGGLSYVRERSRAPVAGHQLDLEAIRDHKAFLTAHAEATMAFLRWTGVSEDLIAQLGWLFGSAFELRPGGALETVLSDGDLLDDRFAVIHTPGHCAGMVCLRMGDLLFCADHLLAGTNPRLTPSHLEPHNGLALYLASLDRVAAEPGIRLGLAGHETPIGNVYARISAIRDSHLSRLAQIRTICREPHTILEMAATVYPDTRHPSMLLLILQSIATRVEYLEDHGVLRAVGEHTPPRYRATSA